MIYCVVPEALADELYDKLVVLLRRRPEREVIIDRRKSERRGAGGAGDDGQQRELRDRRRRACRASSRRSRRREARRPRRRRRARQPRAGGRGRGRSARPAARSSTRPPSSSGIATNNVAEYRGLLLGLAAPRALGADEVEVVNDSELVAKQINGEYKVKHPSMRPLYLDTMDAAAPSSRAGRCAACRASTTRTPTRWSTRRSTRRRRNDPEARGRATAACRTARRSRAAGRRARPPLPAGGGCRRISPRGRANQALLHADHRVDLRSDHRADQPGHAADRAAGLDDVEDPADQAPRFAGESVAIVLPTRRPALLDGAAVAAPIAVSRMPPSASRRRAPDRPGDVAERRGSLASSAAIAPCTLA